TAARRIAENARYSDLGGFTAELLQLGIAPFPTSGLDVASDYFVARAEIVLDGIPIGYSSVIERRDGRLRVIARARGTL
ncbi:MAG TPA: hypothetical protein VFO79_13290, partial [Xanthomonadales bacterium]|nr:hypothetical protein [Xanthomonadales bacterium]